MTQQLPSRLLPPYENRTGTAAMVLGILSLSVPWLGFICGILAIVLGRRAMKLVDAGMANNRSQAKAGFICGVISVCLYAVLVFFVVVVVNIFGNGDFA